MKEQIMAVQRMQDYISENLQREITLSELAEVSLFSPFHSHRLFREYTGLTPADYIRRLRLAKSALRLKNEGCRVIDAALDLGFGSVDGYTRAFHREFGCNPKEYALSPVPITLFIPYGVKFKELRKETIHMENVKNVFIQVIRKPMRKVVIKRGLTWHGGIRTAGRCGFHERVNGCFRNSADYDGGNDPVYQNILSAFGSKKVNDKAFFTTSM